MKSVKLRWLGDQVLKVIVVLSVAWTFLSLIMFAKVKLSPSHPNLETKLTVTLPKLSPSIVYQGLPVIQRSLATLSSSADSLNQPVRLAVVFQPDSTCFVELTYVDECGCSKEKLDRYSITRTVIDPNSGIILTRLGESNLSAERLTRYFGGLTRIRRIQ